jgi:hypothetical protein
MTASASGAVGVPDARSIPNPWYDPRNSSSHRTFEVGSPIAEEYGFTFYATPGRASVLAVDANGKAVTECVTQKGAVRELVRRGLINSEDYVDPDIIPDGTASSTITVCRRIVANMSAEKHDGILIDAQSAQAVVSVHDALSPEKRAKFATMPVARACDVAWKVLARCS